MSTPDQLSNLNNVYDLITYSVGFLSFAIGSTVGILLSRGVIPWKW